MDSFRSGGLKEANELAGHAGLVGVAGVLHGDVAQADRDRAMDSFRSGGLKCLIATDIAARGVDVPAVDLVINYHPPLNVDSYVHRAGRTGRAGRKGTSLTLYDYKEQAQMRVIMHKTGAKFARVGPPQLSEVVDSAARDAVKTIDLVHQDNIEAFSDVAKELIKERGAEFVLASALAAMAGCEKRLVRRSLLTSNEGYVCVHITAANPVQNTNKAWFLARKNMPEDASQAANALKLCADGKSFVLDVPQDSMTRVLNHPRHTGTELAVVKDLPALQDDKNFDIEAEMGKVREKKEWLRAKIQTGKEREQDRKREEREFKAKGEKVFTQQQSHHPPPREYEAV